MTTSPEWAPLSGTALALVRDTGDRLAEYQYGDERHHPFLTGLRPYGYPAVLEACAPFDHPWHLGLWFSWKRLDRTIYWEDRLGYGGDGPAGRTVVRETEVAAGSVRQRIGWVSAEEGLQLDEVRTITATAHAEERAWSLDWEHEFFAPRPVTIRATPFPENRWGGYGGLSFRPARSMADGERIDTADGEGDAGHGEPSRWASYAGHVDGDPAADPRDPSHPGVVIFDHPANPGYPSPKYLWSAADGFGFIAAAPAMRGPLALERGQRIRFRFRTTVFDRLPSAEAVDALAPDAGHEHPSQIREGER